MIEKEHTPKLSLIGKTIFYFKKTARGIERNKRISQALILTSFLITFVIARILANMRYAIIFDTKSGQLHVHHLVPGIFLLIISGYIGISFWHEKFWQKFSAILFGVGAALTIDEFALWFYLKDVYRAKQGRASVDAIVIIFILFLFSLIIAEAHDYFIFKQKSKIL